MPIWNPRSDQMAAMRIDGKSGRVAHEEGGAKVPPWPAFPAQRTEPKRSQLAEGILTSLRHAEDSTTSTNKEKLLEPLNELLEARGREGFGITGEKTEITTKTKRKWISVALNKQGREAEQTESCHDFRGLYFRWWKWRPRTKNKNRRGKMSFIRTRKIFAHAMRDGGSEEFKDEFKSHRLYMVHSKVNKEID